MSTQIKPDPKTKNRSSGERHAYTGPGMIATGEATALLPTETTPPIKVFGTESIRETFDDLCLQQAVNSRLAPGVTDLVLNPDAHCGYGAPVGCVMVSPTHIYPGPVGVDIKCSMSLLQLDLPAEAIEDRKVRRQLISAICQRTPTGAGKGQRSAVKSRHVNRTLGKQLVVEGASDDVCKALGIPTNWAHRCEDSFHVGHDETADALESRLETLLHRRDMTNFTDKMQQLGSYGGGNHFGECEVVEVGDNDRAREVAETFGLHDGKVAFLSHCGSRGFGHILASGQFKSLQTKFDQWGIPLPAGDRQLVYAPLGSGEANDYIDDMSLGANFATVNHLLINALVLEAFQEVFPGVKGNLVYFISHNIARKEIVDDRPAWVHRKGATRAIPGGHHSLRETPFAKSGHPILLPGNPCDGSAVMVADEGAAASCYSVNHGAGRVLGRRHAKRVLDQTTVDSEFESNDVLSNCRKYPIDEAPAAYKDFNEVLRSVKSAGLASEVARLKARFVIKDASKADD
ncbi:RNA-splicing ligase RtcB [Rubripirellula obstinata]|uniref:tRNA-splicing ligase RtcB n=2 Tax=Rubripirellula obstinata TaxID=406547 RepID=A0A5B1CR03_9BACT|nr:RtcB family protein [Rubripirellula obstinata]KAA1261813.1 RNA-splicing ligase RtcB [Rubripirellula obstinata]